jgi:predicted small secreted protein
MAISLTSAPSPDGLKGNPMKTIATLFALTVAMALAGCNTVRGVGQDVQKAGEVLQDAAKR